MKKPLATLKAAYAGTSTELEAMIDDAREHADAVFKDNIKTTNYFIEWGKCNDEPVLIAVAYNDQHDTNQDVDEDNEPFDDIFFDLEDTLGDTIASSLSEGDIVTVTWIPKVGGGLFPYVHTK